jgi:hypothetical protein
MKPIATALLLALLSGCAPPCGQVCRKVLDCGLDSERVSRDECELSCTQEEQLYESWDNPDIQAAYDDHRRCLLSSSCDEIAAGECYNELEELFVF